MFFKLLFGFHKLVAGIIGFSTLATLLGFAPGPGLKRKEMLILLAIFLFFVGTGYWAWRLQQQGNQTAATILLVVIWLLILFGVNL